MDQYSQLLTSAEYAAFILENADYATELGFDVSTKDGLTEAMDARFLFGEFLKEEAIT